MSQERLDKISLRVSPPVDSVPCPDCGTAVGYYDEVNSTHFVCPKCLVLFQVEDGKPTKRIVEFKKQFRVQPALPIGSTGAFRGRTWRVLGVLHCYEAKDQTARWLEYVLREEKTGEAAQLAVYDGHWTFIEPAKSGFDIERARPARDTIVTDPADGTVYSIYHQYSPRLAAAIGEFDWNPTDDSTLNIWEFIAPPRMLVGEAAPGAKVPNAWYRAEHVDADELAAAFGVSRQDLGKRTGVGAIQPAPGEEDSGLLLKLAVGLAALAIVVFLGLQMLRPDKVVMRQYYATQPELSPETGIPVIGGAGRPIVSESFDVEGPTALSVVLTAEITNSWLEVGATLVNDQTGQTYEFVEAPEYYEGLDGGENWTEGSREVQATLGGIPAGRYHFNFSPYSDGGKPTGFQVIVMENTPLTSNLIVVLVIILIWPVIQVLRRRNHEQQRWYNSEFTPDE